MNDQMKVMMLIFFMTTLLMLVFSSLMYQSQKEKRYVHQLQFWLGSLLFTLPSIAVEGRHLKLVGLTTLGLVVLIFTIINLTSDLAGKNLYKPWQLKLAIGAYTLSFILGYLDFSFSVYTFPACLAISFIGITTLIECFRSIPKKKMTGLHYFFFLNLLVLFVHMLDFPFFRNVPEFAPIGFGIALFNIVAMAIILPGITINDLMIERSEILQAILEERNLQLESQSKMSSLGEIAASLVHELNNPLSILLSRNGLLKRNLENDKFDKEALITGLTQMDTTIQRMMKITQSLKSFSRNSELDPMRAVQLKSLMDETIPFCIDRFLDVKIPLMIGEVPDLCIECRSVQLSQVLLNLLNNAYDAVQGLDNQWVKIQFETHEGNLRIHVIDSGKGIPEAIRAKIMLPFFTTKTIGKGTGLGLSISQEIIRNHRGKLYIDSDHLNTNFVIELPIAQN